ncbi:MAG: molybdenum cofactor guanylyltransferase, partial [Deltaproteobacteria bacterium]
HALSRLAPVVSGSLFVATGAERVALPGCSRAIVVADDPPGRGPLGGIAAALWRSRTGVLALACDLPLVTPATLERVLRAGLAADRPAALRSRRGWEPLVAYYPRWVLPRVVAALDRKSIAPRVLLDRLGAVAVRPRSEDEVLNVNTPEDLARALELAGGEERR